MFFQPGKRKGNSTIRVVDVDKKRCSNISLPTPTGCTVEAEQDEDDILSEYSPEINENDEFMDSDFESESDAKPSYKHRKERLSANWERIRTRLLESSLKLEGFVPAKCTECGCDRPVKTCCRDCSYCAYYCLECCNIIHKNKLQLHIPEIIQEDGWTYYDVPGRIFLNQTHECNAKFLKAITVIDLTGFQHNVEFEYCTCQGIPETLLYFDLWSASPVQPSLAFTTRLMKMTVTLMIECHVSIYDLVKALEFFENPLLKKKKVYKQFLDSFEEFRYHTRMTKYYVHENKGTTFESPKCPACPKVEGKLFVSLDACFGLPRKKTSGTSYRQPLSENSYFFNQDEVDNFMSTYPSSSKEQGEGKDCSDFQAGSEITSKGRYHALDETAVSGLCCKHAVPMKFLNLKGGERLGYAVYLLNDLIDKKGHSVTIHFMYDICCLLKSHLQKQNNTELLSAIQLACPQFHVYGHGAKCQLLYSPRRLEGWGLVDGEVLERLWSYLRLFRKMTKEMTASHCEDILSDALYYYSIKQRSRIVLLLKVQWQRALELIVSATKEIEELQENSPVPITEAMIHRWKQQEYDILKKSKADQVDLGPHKWILPYFSVLRQYYFNRDILVDGADNNQSTHVAVLMNSLNNRLVKMERENGVITRWTPTDAQYTSSLVTLEAVKAKETLDMILVSGRRRWFLLSLKKKYAVGQQQAKRLSKSVTKESGNLRNLLKKYNSSVDILRQTGYQNFSDLTWEEVSDVSSAIYAINIPNEDQIHISVKRAAVDALSLSQRSTEVWELEQEMVNTVQVFFNVCMNTEAFLNSLKAEEGFLDSDLLKGLYSLRKKELDNERFNLFAACNLYKDVIAIPEDLKSYVDKHFIHASKTHEVTNALEEEDQEEEEEDQEEDEEIEDIEYEELHVL